LFFFGSSCVTAHSAEPVPAKRSVEGKSPAPIVVMRGRNGLTITSEDLQALDEFERLLSAAEEGANEATVSVFYLKNAKAQSAAQELETLLAGGSADSKGSSNKGSGRLTTGPTKITPDTRLNVLLVLANRTDKQTIKQLLTLLDIKESPDDIAVVPKPRMIPVAYARAKDIADIVRAVYADRLVLSQAQQNQQARAAEMAMMMRAMVGDYGGGDAGFGGEGLGGGARGGAARGGGQNNRADQANRISISVDNHTNTLIVAATDPVFKEVKKLVGELDAASAEQHQTVQVIPLRANSAKTVQRALAAVAGDAVQAKNTATNAPGNNQNSPFGANRGNNTRTGQPGMGGQPFGGRLNGGGFGGPGGSGGPGSGPIGDGGPGR